MKVELNKIYRGDCLNVMAQWPENFVDTIITDPPYGLAFMGKDWDQSVPGPRFWQEMLRIAKPGALLLTFGGTRTYHRMACAVEDAGWQVRDCLMWLYGSGFPKSLDISKAIDKTAGHWRGKAGATIDDDTKRSFGQHYEWTEKGEPITATATAWDGWGTALKPAWEPILLAMKPLDGTFAENAERWGVAGLNVDGGRIEGQKRSPGYRVEGATVDGNSMFGNNSHVNTDTSKGRWPANLLLDEKAAGMLDGVSGATKSTGGNGAAFDGKSFFGGASATIKSGPNGIGFGDSGGASRFFYVAKSSRGERNEGMEGMECGVGALRDSGRGKTAANFHPTVKPLDLMKYLCNLTRTPTGGIVLDPFSGSGSTLWAAEYHNRPWLGIEMNPEYAAIADARLARERSQMKMDL